MSDELQIVEYNDIRVVTTKQVAKVYGTTHQIVSNDFNRNKKKFTEGKHYFKLTGDELKRFRELQTCNHQNDDCKNLDSTERRLQVSDKTRVLYLWTNRGALLLAKIINTDVAWEAYERLVDFYFDKKEEKVHLERVDKFPEEPQRLNYNTSSTLIPRNPNWYARNRRRMNALCEKANVSLSYLYHCILTRLGEEFDLDSANRIYEEENGRPPKYALDIVSYFTELGKFADVYLDKLEDITFRQ